MIGSHNKKFIFFHLYKTGGTSMRSILTKYGDFKADKHDRPKKYMDNFGKENYDKYFTFAFVRNPFDWQVSLYHYMLKDRSHFQHNLIKSFKNYGEYIEWRVNEDCKPQYLWLSENSDLESPITLDFVGKYEKINEDFNFIKNKLLIEGDLPHTNKTTRTHFRDYYDKKSTELMIAGFKKDFEYFNYDKNPFQ